MASELSEPKPSAQVSRPVSNVGRMLVFVALALATAVALWALTKGGDRDLWSSASATYRQALRLLQPS